MLNNNPKLKNPYNWTPPEKHVVVSKLCPVCGVKLELYPDLDIVRFYKNESVISDEKIFDCPACGSVLQMSNDFDLFEKGD